jgi:hypothetical protein
MFAAKKQLTITAKTWKTAMPTPTPATAATLSMITYNGKKRIIKFMAR